MRKHNVKFAKRAVQLPWARGTRPMRAHSVAHDKKFQAAAHPFLEALLRRAGVRVDLLALQEVA